MLHANGTPYTQTSAANAAATIALPAIAANLAYQIDTLTFSYNGTPAGGLLTIADGSTIFYEEAITAAGAGPEIVGFRIPAGRQATITLSAGGAGVIGRINASVSQAIAAPDYAPDPHATAFLTAAAITDATQRSAIDQLVKALKSNGTWSKYKAIYPLVGGNARSHSFNLKDPRDLDAALRVAWSGDVEHDSQGVKSRGGWGETFYNGPVGVLGFYSPAPAPTIPFAAIMGHTLITNGVSLPTRALLFHSVDNALLITSDPQDNQLARFNHPVNGPIGFFAYSYAPSTEYFVQRDRQQFDALRPIPSIALASGGLTVMLLAMRTSTTLVQSPTSIQCSLFLIADFLTRSELANDAIAFQAYQAALGRAVRGYGG